MNIAQILERSQRLFPDKTALIFENQSFTYRELDEMSNRVANGLANLGVARGDRVAIYLPNIPEFIGCYFGIHKIGAIAVCIYSAYKADETQFMLNDSGASVLVTTEALCANVSTEKCWQLKQLLIVEHNLREWMASAWSIARAVDCAPNDPAVLLYTAAISGLPKGATLSHENVVSTARASVDAIRLTPGDNVLLFLPMVYALGQNAAMLPCFDAGATLVLHREYGSTKVLQSIVEHRVTVFFGMPTVYIVLFDKASVEQMRSVRFYDSASCARLPLEIARRWREKFGVDISAHYGMAETTTMAYDHHGADKPGSIGTPVAGVEMQVVDERGHRIAAGQVGEIVVRGPNVMLGYWNCPAETDTVLKNGWFHTGDLGRRDDDGNFYIEGTLLDIVSVGGQTVYSVEVERVLRQHPAIAEVAVYGVPDQVMGEQVRASIVLKSGLPITAEELIAFCSQHLADLKVPKGIEFVESLPKDQNGQVRKQVLCEQFQAGLLTGEPTTEAAPISRESAQQWIIQWLSHNLSLDVGVIETDRPMVEYGFKSLLALTFALDLHRWSGRSISPLITLDCPTVDALVRYLANGGTSSSARPTLTTKDTEKTDWTGLSDDELEKLVFDGYALDSAELKPVARDRDIPLALSQQGVWQRAQSQPNTLAFNFAHYYRLTGKLDVAVLRASLDEMSRRHEILRTAFALKNDSPIQVIAPDVAVNLSLSDLRKASNQSQAAENRMNEETQRPFDYATAPLWRVPLLQLGEESFILGLVTHHIIMDAASVDLFFKELSLLYNAFRIGKPSPLPALPIQYADYACWQQQTLTSEVLSDRRNYWKQWLTEEPPPLALRAVERLKLATDQPCPPAKAYVGSEWSQIPPDLTRRLVTLSQQSGVTLATTVLASFVLLLSQSGGGENIVVGVPFAGRNHPLLEPLIGLFATGTFPLGIKLQDHSSFLELLKRVQRKYLATLALGDVPVEPLVRTWQPERDLRRHPLCRVLLNWFPESPETHLEFADVTATPMHLGGMIGRDLVLNVWEEKTDSGIALRGQWRYRGEVFEPGAIAKMANDLGILLEQIVAHPEQSVDEVPSFTGITAIETQRNPSVMGQ